MATGPSVPATVQATAPGATEQPELIGTWDHEYDQADAQVILEDFSRYAGDADRVVARFGFADEDTWWLGFLFDGDLLVIDGAPEGDGGTYTVAGDEIAMKGNHGDTVVIYDYSLTGRGLTLTAFEECTLKASGNMLCEHDRSKMESLMLLATDHTFIRSGNKATY